MKTHLPVHRRKEESSLYLQQSATAGESGEGTRRTQTYFWQFLILVDASQAPILNSSAEFIQGNSLCSQGHKGVGPETAGQQSRAFYLVLSGSRWGKAQIFQGETKAV